MKYIIKLVMPPFFYDFLKKLKRSKYGWHGHYNTWQDAEESATGYDEDKILHAVRTSLLKVQKGEAVYERDSVLFDKIQYSWPLLSGLMFAAAKNHGQLHVLDFGGSLGSTYFQNKKFLDRIENVSWNVVEQKHFVDVGKEEFENDRLKFFYTIEECFEKSKINVLVLSSVLQYLEDPYMLLAHILQYNFDCILIDRTSFSKKDHDEIKLQIVPDYIYSASYPCWFLNEWKLVKYFEERGYVVIEQFNGADGEGKDVVFKGFIMEKEC